MLVRTLSYRTWEGSNSGSFVPCTESIRFPFGRVVLDNVSRVTPAKFNRNPQVIEMILVELLVFSPW